MIGDLIKVIDLTLFNHDTYHTYCIVLHRTFTGTCSILSQLKCINFNTGRLTTNIVLVQASAAVCLLTSSIVAIVAVLFYILYHYAPSQGTQLHLR